MPVILGRAQVQGEELGWIGRRRLHEGHPRRGEGRQAQIPDDVGDAVQFRRQRLSRHAVERARRQGSDRARRSRQARGARDGRAPCCKGVERSSGSSRLARRPLRQVRARRARSTTRCGTTRRCSRRPTTSSGRWARSRSTPIYPADGVAVADSPLGFVDHGRGAEVEKFFTDLRRLSCSPDAVRKRIADTGRRIPLGGPAIRRRPSRTGTSIRAAGDGDPHARARGDPRGARPLPGGACASRR